MTGASRSERGVVLVEAMVALPACVLAALALVDCGVVVRDRVAVTHAATRAAAATLEGGDAEAAARGALPPHLRDDMELEAREDGVAVSLRSRPPLLARAGGIEVASEAAIAAGTEGRR